MYPTGCARWIHRRQVGPFRKGGGLQRMYPTTHLVGYIADKWARFGKAGSCSGCIQRGTLVGFPTRLSPNPQSGLISAQSPLF